MATIDYKEKYEQALERARQFSEKPYLEDSAGIVEYIFPELKESEDERIRKALINGFNKFDQSSVWYNGITNGQILAWLEKQGEQKSTDNIEPKFKVGDKIIHKELGGDFIHNSHTIIQVDMVDKKYRLEGGLVAHFSEQDYYELVKQKPAWSEEDKKNIDFVIKHVELVADEKRFAYIFKWLKSLKDRVQPQPKQEWSEEDETMIALLHNIISHQYSMDIIKKEEQLKLEDWLKSLRPQNTWKPSDEQMDN